MKSLKDIRKLIVDLEIKPGSDMKNKVLNEAIQLHQDQNKQKTSNTWRFIMKNRATKFATAAAIVLVALLSITFFNSTAPSAYAIEQTIEAMRSIDSFSATLIDWDNSQGKILVKLNPNTGNEEYYYADQSNLLTIGTPEATYYYYKDQNLVKIQKGYTPASEISFLRIFEELPEWVEKHNGKYNFSNRFDEVLRKEIILIHVELPTFEKEFNIRIDPITKLPISINGIKAKPGQGVKGVDNIEYNITIPKRTFEFEIPDGAKVVNE